MLKSIFGQKVGMTQVKDKNGFLVPVTVVYFPKNIVVDLKTNERDGYTSVVIAFGERKKIKKPIRGILQKAGVEENIGFLREFRVERLDEIKIGMELNPEEILKNTEKVSVQSISKGKGFQGAIKRHGFSRGPKTHGSNHYRKTGSIGHAEIPAEVDKGKKMPGRMGGNLVTTKNLKVVDFDSEKILIKGAVSGPNGVFVKVTVNKF